jgi:methionyl-tRNA formyltransferase
MGTPEFAVPSLQALAADEHYALQLVLTRPDAASGRGKTLLPSAVRVSAEALGLPVSTPTGGLEPQELPPLASAPDFVVVAAYGRILPDALLSWPRLGCINVHASLLPRWRGAAPVQRAILAGDIEAGVSIMRMESGLDTGAFCAQASVPIADKDASTLSAELAQVGAQLLLAALPAIAAGTASWQEQEHSEVTYANKVEKHELLLSPQASAVDNLRRVRAASDSAPARCVVAERSATVLKANMAREVDAVPGQLLVIGKHLYLGTADGAIELISIKPDGKQAMPAAAFAAGLRGATQLWDSL